MKVTEIAVDLLGEPLNSTVSDVTDKAAKVNRVAWDSFRRGRDEGVWDVRPDSAAAILAGKRFLYPENLELAGGDVHADDS